MNIAKAPLLLAPSTFLSLAMAGEITPYSQTRFDQLSVEGKPVLLDVQASWCPTCKAQEPIIRDLMGQSAYTDVTTLTIDFDADKPLLKKYKVGMQSTLIAFKGTKEVGRSVGDTTKSGIEGLIKKAAN